MISTLNKFDTNFSNTQCKKDYRPVIFFVNYIASNSSSAKSVGLSINFSSSKKKEAPIGNASERSSEGIDFGMEGFGGGIG
jgi:hypothetical protein